MSALRLVARRTTVAPLQPLAVAFRDAAPPRSHLTMLAVPLSKRAVDAAIPGSAGGQQAMPSAQALQVLATSQMP